MRNRLAAIILSTVLAVSLAATAFPEMRTVNAVIGDVNSQDDTGLKAGQTAVLYDGSIGMPTSEANAIAQTADGFIWIGSYSGLVRYDGNEFVRWGTDYGIASVVSLLVDSKDRIWVGMNDAGVMLIDKDNYEKFDREDGLVSLSSRSLAEDKNGNILIGTMEGLFYVDPKNALHRIDDERVNDEYIVKLKKSEDGELVYGVLDNGSVFILDELKVTDFISEDAIPYGKIDCVLPEKIQSGENEGMAYFGTKDNKVIYGNLKNGLTGAAVYEIPDNENINDLCFVANSIYICADKGISHMKRNGSGYIKLQKVAMTNSVDSMMEDYEGNLWFTSSRQGVMKITTSIFTDISRLAGLDDDVVANTTCVWRDRLYVGTDNGLIVIDATEKRIQDELTNELEGVRIRSIKQDSKGNLLICTYSNHGLYVIHPDGTTENINEEKGLISNRIRTVTELSDGRYVVATNAGVQFIENGVPGEVYNSGNKLESDEMLTICEGPDGNVFLGGNGDGVHIIKADGSVENYGIGDGLNSEVILRIKKDPYRDVYWIVTSNSIAFYRDGKFETVEKFPYPNNFDIFADSHGGMWILGSNGIYNTTAEELLANGEIEYVHYNTEAGLPHVTTGNSRNYIDDNGNLYISGTSGITMMNINKSHDSKSKVRLAVPFIKVDDEYVYIENNTLNLSSDVKRITIYGYALSYALNNTNVRYRLEGFDENFSTATKGTLSPVEYTNLPGGTYTFHLATTNSLTGKEESEIDVTIIKEKALSELWWFWIIVIAVFAAAIIFVVAFIFRRRAKAAEKREKAKQTFIDEMINAFAKIIDIKDRYTNGHSFRVARYTAMLAKEMGKSDAEVNRIKNIAMLHDIGKISIPDEILNKPEALNDEEYQIMKTHASVGYDILKDITVDPDLSTGAGYHHERLDGKGYPFGKAGDEIPEVARIIAVADTFDAMYSTRPYRKKMELSECVRRIKEAAGTQLDPSVVEAFVRLYEAGKLENDYIK